jgi:hypothetical protein
MFAHKGFHILWHFNTSCCTLISLMTSQPCLRLMRSNSVKFDQITQNPTHALQPPLRGPLPPYGQSLAWQGLPIFPNQHASSQTDLQLALLVNALMMPWYSVPFGCWSTVVWRSPDACICSAHWKRSALCKHKWMRTYKCICTYTQINMRGSKLLAIVLASRMLWSGVVI